jgi:hypothetical protein
LSLETKKTQLERRECRKTSNCPLIYFRANDCQTTDFQAIGTLSNKQKKYPSVFTDKIIIKTILIEVREEHHVKYIVKYFVKYFVKGLKPISAKYPSKEQGKNGNLKIKSTNDVLKIDSKSNVSKIKSTKDVLKIDSTNDVLKMEHRSQLNDDDDLQKTKRQRIAEWLEHRSKQSEEVDSNDDNDQNESKLKLFIQQLVC